MMFSSTLRACSIAVLIALSHTVYCQRERDTFTSLQPLEVSGQVRSADLGEPARNVPVRLERFSGGIVEQMTTDSLGRFRFTGLQRGYYTVVVEAPGFEPVRQQADLQVLFKAFLMFELTKKSLTPESYSLFVLDARVPESARNEFSKARAALADKKTKVSIEHLERAIFFYPEFFDAHLMLGTGNMDLRQWEKAEAAFRRALEIKGDSAPALFSLGEAYWREKRYAEAESTLLDGLKLDDTNWHGHFTLGRLYWDMDEVMRAGPAVGRTLQLKPDFAEAHLLAGNILLRLKQEERALAEYQEYLKLAPKGEFAVQTRELVQKLSKAVVEKK